MDPREALERIVVALERIAATLDPTEGNAAGLPIVVLEALQAASDLDCEAGKLARQVLRDHGYR